MTHDNVSTVTPDASIPDDEQRYLAASAAALEDAQRFLSLAADAREARDAGVEDLELAQDEMLELRGGITRAAQRRARDCGALVRGFGGRGRR